MKKKKINSLFPCRRLHQILHNLSKFQKKNALRISRNFTHLFAPEQSISLFLFLFLGSISLNPSLFLVRYAECSQGFYRLPIFLPTFSLLFFFPETLGQKKTTKIGRDLELRPAVTRYFSGQI